MEETTALFDNLFRNSYPKLYFYAKGLVGQDEAEDVVEEVFAELWKRKNEVEMGDKINAFLYRAVYTRCINVLRKRRISASVIDTLDAINEKRMETMETSAYIPDKQVENKELGKAIDSAVDELPDKCRMVFRLSYIQDMHNDEIAKTMNISVRTVEAHMYHALKYLRNRLSKLIKIFIIFMLIY